jgi:tetratricopeptide (TPR) repeat protein
VRTGYPNSSRCDPIAGSRYRSDLWQPVASILLLGLIGCVAPRQATVSSAKVLAARELAEQALDAEERGDVAGAESLLEDAIRSNPLDCETRLHLSELLLKHGDLQTATQHLEQLAAQNPDDPRIYFRLAQTEYLLRHTDRTQNWLSRGLELDPDNEEGLLLSGRLAEGRGSRDVAVETYMHVLDVAPESSRARLRLAALLNEAQQPERAAPHARRVLDSDSACPLEIAEANWILGESYVLLGREAEGVELMARAASGRSMSADSWHELALLQTRLGQWQPADASVSRALALNPDREESLTLRAFLARRMAPETRTVAASLAPSDHPAPAAYRPDH